MQARDSACVDGSNVSDDESCLVNEVADVCLRIVLKMSAAKEALGVTRYKHSAANNQRQDVFEVSGIRNCDPRFTRLRENACHF